MKIHIATVLFSAVMTICGESYDFPNDTALYQFKPTGNSLSAQSPEIASFRGYFRLKKELPAGVYLARLKYRTPGVEKVQMDCFVFNETQNPKSAGQMRFRASSDWEETAGIIRLTRPGTPRFSFVCNKTKTIPEEYFKRKGNLEIRELEITALKSDPLVPNGDFRYGISMPAGWMPSPSGLAIPARVGGDNGSGIMRVANQTDKIQHVYSSPFPLEKKHYQISFQAKAQGESSSLTLRLVSWNWKWTGGKLSRTLEPDWKKYSVDVTVPEAYLVFMDLWCGPGTCEIRDLRIEESDAVN